MMLLAYGTKPFDDAPTFPAGWTSLGSATDGSVAAGIDVGSMRIEILYKEHTGSESNPLCTNTTNNVSGACIISFSKDSAADLWEPPVGSGGGDSTAGTVFQCSSASSLNIFYEDMMVAYAAIRSDAGTQTSITINSSGSITYGTFVQTPTELVTASGGDMAMAGGYVPVTASVDNPNGFYISTYNATLGAAHTGSAFMVRLRLRQLRKPAVNRNTAVHRAASW